jgi:hypothetical protein
MPVVQPGLTDGSLAFLLDGDGELVVVHLVRLLVTIDPAADGGSGPDASRLRGVHAKACQHYQTGVDSDAFAGARMLP